MALWLGAGVGLFLGYILCLIKVWDCILNSWRTREITRKLEGYPINTADYSLGWLEGHRAVVRELDQSPWAWFLNRHKITKIILESEKSS